MFPIKQLKRARCKILVWWHGMPPIKRTLIALLSLTLLMFGFTFSLIPLYSVFCKVTGINGKVDLTLDDAQQNATDYEKQGRYRTNAETVGRLITVEFDANVHPNMPFEFVPEHIALQTSPGTLNHTSYYVKNKTDKTIIIQAIPSISPGIVAKHLKKLECFCFNKQTLKPYEEARLTLRFWLEPEFPESVHRLTLSYTIFDVTKSSGELSETTERLEQPFSAPKENHS